MPDTQKKEERNSQKCVCLCEINQSKTRKNIQRKKLLILEMFFILLIFAAAADR
jgi:uncharacterized membrane protein YvbJ